MVLSYLLEAHQKTKMKQPPEDSRSKKEVNTAKVEEGKEQDMGIVMTSLSQWPTTNSDILQQGFRPDRIHLS